MFPLNKSADISGIAGNATLPPALGTNAPKCANVTLFPVVVVNPTPGTGLTTASPYWSNIEPSPVPKNPSPMASS